MSQKIWSSINPTSTSGVMLAGLLNDFKDALMTGCSGTSRPANLQAGGLWIDTTKQAAPNYYWAFKFYTGSTDVEVFRISIINGFGGTLVADGTFEIEEIAADVVGPILELLKSRLTTANNGQILSGDAVAEIRFIGRTNTGTDPVVGYFKFSATDDQTTSTYGGTLSMYSTPNASAAITEHLRFINGVVESVTPHKLNSLRLVSQNVATTATIAVLDASVMVIEMTGSTATDIQGINAAQNSQSITIHNRSTANVTLKHQNASASAANRMILPKGFDQVIEPQASVSLYYCSTDARWKLKTSTYKKTTRVVEKLNGGFQQWTAPSGVTRIRVTGFGPSSGRLTMNSYIDSFGGAYTAGLNTNGELGDGTVIAKSSPVAVIGGLQFKTISMIASQGTVALSTSGPVYAWGLNSIGDLGLGDALPRSSPVAVLGGLKFSELFASPEADIFAITPSGKLYAWGESANFNLGIGTNITTSSPVAVLGGINFSRFNVVHSSFSAGLNRVGAAYAWGVNDKGQLGLGDVSVRSSPVAILGGLTFKKLSIAATGIGKGFMLGIAASTGSLYAWGDNGAGQLGVGDIISRSSPVAVLGGLTFYDALAVPSASSAFALTSTGTLYGWGENLSGQLGVGDKVRHSSPVAVLGGLSFKKISAVNAAGSTLSILGLTTTGVLYAWGANANGQLGLGDTVDRSSPVAVLGGLFFSQINIDSDPAGTGIVSRAITEDGIVYSWGINTKGFLGVGDIIPRSSPVAVIGAFGGAPDESVFESVINVTPSTTYDVVLSHGQSMFGCNPIGINVDNITIEYES